VKFADGKRAKALFSFLRGRLRAYNVRYNNGAQDMFSFLRGRLRAVSMDSQYVIKFNKFSFLRGRLRAQLIRSGCRKECYQFSFLRGRLRAPFAGLTEESTSSSFHSFEVGFGPGKWGNNSHDPVVFIPSR